MSSNDVVAILLLFVTMLFWGATPLLEKLGLKEVEPLTNRAESEKDSRFWAKGFKDTKPVKSKTILDTEIL